LKIPVSPPAFGSLFNSVIESGASQALEIFNSFGPVDDKERYLHWDKIRHLEAPEGFTNEQWWAGIKFSRRKIYQSTPFQDKHSRNFNFCVPGPLQKELHWLDMHTAGTIAAQEPIANKHMKTTYLIKSLIEESISSSQLEGAVTTKDVAKEMIRQGREPKDKSEKMILNNYYAMQFIHDFKNEKLTPSMVLELHKILTEKTLEDPNKAGQFRQVEDDIHVVDEIGQVLHTPPNAEELPERLEMICAFANGELDETFVHPVVRAIILHFMIGYDHPFVDGNGRTARAVFYWSMSNANYWLMEFISISRIIKNAPSQYGKAYLNTETDENDLTYFIIHQIDVIEKAIKDLQIYLEEKMKGVEYAEELLEKNDKLRGRLNFRQLALIRHAIKHPRFIYKIKEHQNSHGISYETARSDLLQLSDKLKLLDKLKAGRSIVFAAPPELEDKLRDSS